jgi:hypothetical protein
MVGLAVRQRDCAICPQNPETVEDVATRDDSGSASRALIVNAPILAPRIRVAPSVTASGAFSSSCSYRFFCAAARRKRSANIQIGEKQAIN